MDTVWFWNNFGIFEALLPFHMTCFSNWIKPTWVHRLRTSDEGLERRGRAYGLLRRMTTVSFMDRNGASSLCKKSFQSSLIHRILFLSVLFTVTISLTFAFINIEIHSPDKKKSFILDFTLITYYFLRHIFLLPENVSQIRRTTDVDLTHIINKQ